MPRLRRSHLIALAVAVALTLWLLSGQLTGGRDLPSAEPVAAGSASLTRVRVEELSDEMVSEEVLVAGRTEAARSVTLRAEIDGRVVAVPSRRGARVAAGALLLRLDTRDFQAQLTEASALVQQRELEHQAAQRLVRSNMMAETEMLAVKANLEAAQARRRRIEISLANAEIRAPFAGVLEARPVEEGHFAQMGDEVARLLEMDPLVVSGNVSQSAVSRLNVGMPGEARLVTGERLEGRLRFVAAEADPATRTFRIELEVPNPEARISSGVTAEILVRTGESRAHLLSPAVLTLGPGDELGVKVVNGEDRVEFQAVAVVRATTEGFWVTGLGLRPRVITVGHGFVHPGDQVIPVLAEAALARPGAAQP